MPNVSGLSRDDLLCTLREMYANELELPLDVVSAEADLETDLGMDSLLQAEMLDRVFRMCELGAVSGSYIASAFPTLTAITDLVSRVRDLNTTTP